jgi:hypothetical protein
MKRMTWYITHWLLLGLLSTTSRTRFGSCPHFSAFSLLRSRCARARNVVSNCTMRMRATSCACGRAY